MVMHAVAFYLILVWRNVLLHATLAELAAVVCCGNHRCYDNPLSRMRMYRIGGGHCPIRGQRDGPSLFV